MPVRLFNRRSFLSRSALATAGVASLLRPLDALAEMPMPRVTGPLDAQLDGYIGAYMPAMNAPGLTLGLTDANSTLRTACYGYANVDQKLAVSEDHLFQIGSITKSFVALVLLQLRDEGKVDLHKSILDYLPGLPISAEFGTITIHHLLTHTSGLPDNQSAFGSDPSARLVQGFVPGEHFHYCNAGFDILGMLAAKLDGRTWRRCVEARILTPLEMTATTGVITTANRDRSATGYEPYWDDQEYPRQGRLAPAPNLTMDDTAGCIASTPGDMARYARMLLNHGKGPKTRIVSEESFALFSTPHIKADDFSPTASYGYGTAVDTLDGHKILRHTGGMVSFASSIHVDLDGGVAAFASINAMQGYRPIAVTEYAVRLMRAQKETKELPAAPALADPRDVDDAGDYAGTFTAPEDRKLIFKAEGKRLSLIDGGQTIPLQHGGGDRFISTVPGQFSEFAFSFGRKKDEAEKAAKPAGASSPEKHETPVVEVTYGPEWYFNPSFGENVIFYEPVELVPYKGKYYSDSAWGGEVQVYILKGQLMLGGDRLTRIGGALFRVGDEPWIPDTAEFMHVFEGKARLLKLGGMDFWRVEVE